LGLPKKERDVRPKKKQGATEEYQQDKKRLKS